MSRTPFVTVVEAPEFISAASRLMGEDERWVLVDFLAQNPLSGDIVVGTGGVRKLRWALAGRGKRGGARVIYFFHDTGMPLFALTAFAKNERADLTQRDRNELRKLTAELTHSFRRKPT